MVDQEVGTLSLSYFQGTVGANISRLDFDLFEKDHIALLLTLTSVTWSSTLSFSYGADPENFDWRAKIKISIFWMGQNIFFLISAC